MKFKKCIFPLVPLIFTVAIFSLAATNPGLTQAAKPSPEAKKLVETSRFTLESFAADPNNVEFHKLLKRAKGVLIFPQQLPGAFIIGAKGGNGVLLTREGESNKWNGPAFYTMGGLTFGIQAGGSASEVSCSL